MIGASRVRCIALTTKFLAAPLSAITGETFDVSMHVDLSRSNCDEFAFIVRGHTVRYRVSTQQLECCGSLAELKPRSAQLHLRILVDRMSVECFGNYGKESMSSVVRGMDTTPAYALQVSGGNVSITSLVVHEDNSIWQTT